jgi:hypothetical protein
MHSDLERTTEELIDYLRQHGRGVGNLIGARQIAQMFDIQPWQATTCAVQARVQLRYDDENLCARRGNRGGYFIAETEEEARLYSLSRSENTLTQIDNIVKDVETALRGIVRSVPSTALYWRRTRTRLNGIAGELAKVRYDLALASGEAAQLEAGETIDPGTRD